MLQRSSIHHWIYVGLTALLCASIAFNDLLMSILSLLTALNWVMEWNWREKWQRVKAHPSAIVSFAFLFVFCLGFIRADQTSVAFDNLISKLLLFLAPVIVTSSQALTRRQLRIVSGAFVLSVTVASIVNFIYFLTHNIVDIREISIFISHIRFALCIDIALILLFAFIIKEENIKQGWRILASVLIVWLLFYMAVSQTLTGIILLMLIILVYAVHILVRHRQQKWMKHVAVAFLAIFTGVAAYTVVLTYQYFHIDKSQLEQLDSCTVNGNPYEHDLHSLVESGSLTGVYVCREELKTAWAQRSDIEYDALTEATLIRYLNSLHQSKDSLSVMAMSDGDVRNVELRIANAAYTQVFGLKKSLYPIFFSYQLYQAYGIVEESTLLQRVECWKASWHQIALHPVLGMGLGDHKKAVDEQLQARKSSNMNKTMMGSHNQFLSFWLMGGGIVLAYFLFSVFYPFIEKKEKISFVYVAFFILMFCSMFTEDTLETQAGMTLYAVMNAILLYSKAGIRPSAEKSHPDKD